MVDSERLGDMVIVEKCYVILGVRRKEMILLFSALQQIINWEREVRGRDDGVHVHTEKSFVAS
eukprot:10082076-Ditylum_brightwellii.AAC.1